MRDMKDLNNENLDEKSRAKAQQVIAIIAEKLGKNPEEITLDSRFREDLQADSLETFEVIYALEEQMGVTILEDKANEFESVRDLVNFVNSRP